MSDPRLARLACRPAMTIRSARHPMSSGRDPLESPGAKSMVFPHFVHLRETFSLPGPFLTIQASGFPGYVSRNRAFLQGHAGLRSRNTLREAAKTRFLPVHSHEGECANGESPAQG